MAKNKTLLIGIEHPDVKSIQWEELSEYNIGSITDYQVLIIDLEGCSNKKPIKVSGQEIKKNVTDLVLHGHTVIYLWPIKNKIANFIDLLPVGPIELVRKYGTTLEFNSFNPIIRVYEKYISEHHTIIKISKDIKGYESLITNNVNELVALKHRNFYILHQPDEQLYEEAIDALVKVFNPELRQEVWEKPDWVLKYELEQLKTKEIEKEIEGFQNKIDSLVQRKEQKEVEKQEAIKWSDLLYTQGNTLELRLKEAFELLGTENVVHEPKGNDGPDLEIKHGDIGFTIEVVGTKNTIELKKARQLLQWKAEGPLEHKYVLIGNPFRELQPSERPPEHGTLIGEQALNMMKENNLVFVTTENIFNLVCEQLFGGRVDITEIFNQLKSSKGEITLIFERPKEEPKNGAPEDITN